jgi:hypothetical protein
LRLVIAATLTALALPSVVLADPVPYQPEPAPYPRAASPRATPPSPAPYSPKPYSPTPAQPSAPAAVPAATSAAAKPVINYPQALILTRSSLIALQQANETGDYSVLYALGSAGFQQVNSPEKLAQIFAPLRQYNLGAVLVLEPVFDQPPYIDANGMLTMTGAFNVKGYHINFRLIYAPQAGHWRLFGISANIKAPQAQGEASPPLTTPPARSPPGKPPGRR